MTWCQKNNDQPAQPLPCDKMSPAERMTALIQGAPIDRVPFNPFASSFSAKCYGIDGEQYYRHPENAFAASMHLIETYPWINYKPSYGWAERGAWEFGGDVAWPKENRYGSPLSAGPVIRTPDEVDTLIEPDPETAGMNPLQFEFNALCIRNGYRASLPGGTPTTLSAGIVGRSNFFRWQLRYPDAVHKLQRKATQFILHTARITMAKYGAPNCSVSCAVPLESNQLISPLHFEKFAKPYIQEIMGFYADAGLGSVVVHLCGDHTRNLPHWADIPLPDRTIFSIGHEMDLTATSRFIGERHILAGNINNMVLLTGTVADVKAEVKRCLAQGMAHPGGFVLMPACSLPPETPLENFMAIGETIATHGYY